MDCSLGRGSFQYHRKPFGFALLERPCTHLSLQMTSDLPSARSDEGALRRSAGVRNVPASSISRSESRSWGCHKQARTGPHDGRSAAYSACPCPAVDRSRVCGAPFWRRLRCQPGWGPPHRSSEGLTFTLMLANFAWVKTLAAAAVRGDVGPEIRGPGWLVSFVVAARLVPSAGVVCLRGLLHGEIGYR